MIDGCLASVSQVTVLSERDRDKYLDKASRNVRMQVQSTKLNKQKQVTKCPQEVTFLAISLCNSPSYSRCPHCS
jgi:hypothetical protein